MKTIFILMDAFRFDYLQEKNTPFLYACASDGMYVKKIIPGNGFCERSEIFTGLSPKETGFFTAINYEPQKKSDYRKIKWLITVVRKFNIKNRFFNRVFRRLLWEISLRMKHPMHPQHIPYELLEYFTLTEDYVDFRDLSLERNKNNIFNFLSENKATYCYENFTSLTLGQKQNDEERLTSTLTLLEKYDFHFLYLTDVDAFGHKFGPGSIELNKKLSKIDSMLSLFCLEAQKKCPDTRFVFLGDHGMVSVVEHLDVVSFITSMLKKHNLKQGKDVLYFLDSTMFRMWKINNKKSDEIQSYFSEIQANIEFLRAGQFLDVKAREDFGIPIDMNYGDIIWWANPGVVIKADFFHQNEVKVKGMHGYINTCDDSKGMCIVHGNDVEHHKVDELHLTDVFQILKNNIKGTRADNGFDDL
jgi:predicted AlkP superfamily pyrophosphatase or phosphodiesterase